MEHSDSNTSLMSVGGVVMLIDVPDLVNLIANFCDDDTLSKVSRVSIIKPFQCHHYSNCRLAK